MNNLKTPPNDRGAAVKALVAARPAAPRPRRILGAALVLLAVAVAVVAWLLLRPDGEADAARYKTAPATVGELVVEVSATGNLQPTNQVEVGSELSGIVERVLVDENDRVKKGQVLARLDVSKLQDTVTKSRANLDAAAAQVLQAQATVAEARATRARFQQVAELSGGKVPSKSEMDTAEANLKRAEANEASARAAVVQARAALRSDETNLRKASIRSPIDGVVLARKVEPGQTVAASFQAPVLFTLAEDLARMELQVDVDEADVGQVKVGQKATFTVDAWPGRLYDAVITRVGYGSQVKEGVVSYLTVLEVDNDDLSLRPGMTGTAAITTLRRARALLVPNAALRFTPPQTDAAEERPGRGLVGFLLPRTSRQTPRAKETPKGSAQRVWVLRDGRPVALGVKVGDTDGRVTEIVDGEIKAGMEVITETESASR